MRLKCLGCEALARLLYTSAAQSPHIVDVELFKLGLHNRPNDLRDRLQERIDATPADEYDAIVLGYGICGKATVGLVSQSLPMIIPRAHDCITLYLGDRMRYKDQFEQQPGTYWYTVDYLERHKAGEALGATAASTDLAEEYEKFVEKFGKDNADYLMEVMGAWQAHYERAAYIDMGVGDNDAAIARAQEMAQRRNWRFERLTGDLVLIRKLILGEWDENFLQVEPGHSIGMSFDDSIVECVLHGSLYS
jgi:hypothetical protein